MGITSKIEKIAKEKDKEAGEIVLDALNSTDSIRSAAKKLKVSPATMVRYIKVYEIYQHSHWYI